MYTFVTGNPNKLREVQEMLKGTGITIQSKVVDLPELQGEPEDIIKEKTRIAAKAINGPVIVEDTSLCFRALNGLPGPYIKWFLAKIGHIGLNNLLAAYDDKHADAQCIFGVALRSGFEPILFHGICPGNIVPARGDNHFGWDPIFQPENSNKTFAEMSKEEKHNISHRSRALNKLKKHLVTCVG